MNTKPKIRMVAEIICKLGEGPVWNTREQKLYWTNITDGDIWVYDPMNDNFELFLHGEFQVGGFAFNRENQMILCTDKGVLKLIDHGKNEFEHLFPEIRLSENERFNDITTDPEGRIYAGTLIPDKKGGKLYLLEKGREAEVLSENLSCTNGMSFSPDQKTFYHTETIERRLDQYNYNRETGAISNPRVFFQGTEDHPPASCSAERTCPIFISHRLPMMRLIRKRA